MTPRIFKLKDIQSDEAICKEYIDLIPTGASFQDVIRDAHRMCPELREFCEINQNKFNGLGARDKGSMGKMVEFYIFGQTPDTDPKPDLLWGADIKGTHFKTNKQGNYNAKERLTITDVGTTNNYSTFDSLMQAESLRQSKYYRKVGKGVLFVFEHTGGKYNGLEQNLSKTLLCAFSYDLEELPRSVRDQIDADFDNIQYRVANRTVSQRGQSYLHIHPHGNKGSKTRALGFKNKFVTKLVSIYTGKPITVKGRSWFIEKRHF